MTFSVGSFTIEIRNFTLWLETARHELFISKAMGFVHSRKLQRTFTSAHVSAA